MEWSRPAFRILVISSILLGFILFPNISDGHASLYPNNRVAVHSYDLSSQSHISKSKELADNLVSELIKKSSSSFGPIGGIGDSGTRGIRDIITKFGIHMLKGAKNVNQETKDSLLFMDLQNVTYSSGEIRPTRVFDVYDAGIYSVFQSVTDFTESSMGSERWHTGRQFVAKLLLQTFRACGGVSTPSWGFKHPRSAMLLPFWQEYNFVFVHVIRDGRDVALGDNTMLFRDECESYYRRPCSHSSIVQKAKFWADLNKDIFDYAIKHLAPSQYVAIRVEDLATNSTQAELCYRRLASYLGLSQSHIDSVLPGIIKQNLGVYASSYLGQKYSDFHRIQFQKEIANSQFVKDQLEFWGYKPAKFGLARDCLSLPWMDLMRNAKRSALPGDNISLSKIDALPFSAVDMNTSTEYEV